MITYPCWDKSSSFLVKEVIKLLYLLVDNSDLNDIIAFKSFLMYIALKPGKYHKIKQNILNSNKVKLKNYQACNASCSHFLST